MRFSHLGRLVVSLARQSLLHEWKRYAAAVLALAFSGLLILVQVGLLFGQFDSYTLPVSRARADLWVTGGNVESWDESTTIAARFEGLLWAHPMVVDVQRMDTGGGDWRTGDGRRQNVTVIGVNTSSDSLTRLRGFNADTLRILSQPDTVVVDRTDAEKLGARVGTTAEIGGKRVVVGGFVDNFRTTSGSYVFASEATLRRLNDDWSAYGPPYFLIRLRNNADARVVARELQSRAKGKTYTVSRPADLIRRSQMFWLISSGSGASFGFSMLLALMVGVGVTSQTLRGAILASLKEYAALRALGVRLGKLCVVVIEQSLWIAAAGVVVMFAVSAAMAMLGRLLAVPMFFPWWASVLTSMFVVAIAVASGLLSMSVLYRSEPADLLR
jgi:putative ABC transport system permease protein